MTKVKLKELCRNIIAKNNPINKTDTVFLLTKIFPNHAWWFQKNTKEILFVDIIDNEWGNKCFQLNYVDGTKDDISWAKSISPPSLKTEVFAILRNIIQPQINFYKDTIDITWERCHLTDNQLLANFHVDHIYPFDDLALDWINENDFNLGVLITMAIDVPNKVGFQEFSNDDLNASWYDYHQVHATLRPTTKEANLRRKK